MLQTGTLETGNFDKTKIKSLKKEAPKPRFFKIHEGTVKKDFEKLHEDGKPLLSTDDKYIVFYGLLELADRSCVHMELKNPTKRTLLFNIRTPASPTFFVRPHVGMLAPGKTTTLYFSFRGKCQRVPSDYCWIYSIYHIPIANATRLAILEDEFSTTKLRSVWIEQGRGDIRNVLHLSCVFDETGVVREECKNRKHKAERNIFLDELGDVVQAGTVEDSRDPGTKPGKPASAKPKQPSSETTDELPKTAESQKAAPKKK